ncbi:glycoside hydrolase family 104 protein, partial [Burkholderia gladioli]|jgi:muramidase (phage lysozyme)|uniref:glycoside hydrolase family 24 protein n=1 Tax=Burkholderia gladioli TaxID=28095 RepID=UPI000F51CEA1|nr:glycoside hydrolase family 104 protein [Burkholderia gladioli]MBW5285757.1 glycoside hydrolase family 104 protein [Burkholderia gladioli]
MARITADQAGGQNVVAFLDMIPVSEIDAYTRAHSDDGYNVLVGSHGPITKPDGTKIPANVKLFNSYATHPNAYDAATNSTAAGRYQLLNKYFQPYARQLHLTDFSPLSQDLIALQQIRERRAIPLIQAGQLAAAIQACCNIWASFPGSPYGQHTNPFSMLSAAYVAAGGKLAV